MFDKIFSIVGVMPGRNEGVGNYVVNPEDNGSVCWSLWSGHPRADFSQLCYAYQRQVNLTAELYANPTSELEAAIKANLVTFYQTLEDPTCEQLFPFGQ